MKHVTKAEFEANATHWISQVEQGVELAIEEASSHKIIAIVSPAAPGKGGVKLGGLKGKATVEFAPDYKMTEEEFIGSK